MDVKKHLDFKAIGKNFLPEAKHVGAAVAGIFGSRMFLDFRTIFASQNTTGSMMATVITHQGAVKAIIGIGGAAVVQHWLPKCILAGVAIDGLIQEIRVFTTDATGGNSLPAISGPNRNNFLNANAASGVLGNMRTNYLQSKSFTGTIGRKPQGSMSVTSSVGCPDYSSY